jgi:hypothetical protein
MEKIVGGNVLPAVAAQLGIAHATVCPIVLMSGKLEKLRCFDSNLQRTWSPTLERSKPVRLVLNGLIFKVHACSKQAFRAASS